MGGELQEINMRRVLGDCAFSSRKAKLCTLDSQQWHGCNYKELDTAQAGKHRHVLESYRASQEGPVQLVRNSRKTCACTYA